MKVLASSVCVAAMVCLLLGWRTFSHSLQQSDGLTLSYPDLVRLQRNPEHPDRATCEIEIVNVTRESIRVVGAATSCSCLTFPDLPLTLSPGECHQARVVADPIGSATQFKIRFLSDSSGPAIDCRLTVDARDRRLDAKLPAPSADPMFSSTKEND